MKTKVAILLILVLAVFMRFYHLPQLLHWTMDEEYWSYIPFNIATGYHFPLIGGSIADTGIYTTPWFVYLMSIIALVGRGNPVVFGIFVSGIGVVTTLLVFWLGRKMFGGKTAFFAAILYSGSMLMSLWDRHYWNASLTPMLSLLALYFVYTRRLILLALVLSLAVSAHGTGVSLVLFVVLTLALWRSQIKIKPLVIAGVIFLLSFSPVFLFEARHNFLELRALANYFTTQRPAEETFPQRLTTVSVELVNTSGKLFIYQDNGDVGNQLTLGDKSLNRGQMQWAAVFMLLLVLASVFLAKRSQAYKLLWFQIAATILGLLIFRSPVSAYYFSPVAISLFFLAGTGVDRFWTNRSGQLLIIVLTGLFLWFNLTKMISAYHSSSYPAKLEAVKEAIRLTRNQPFSFNVSCRGHCQPYGFRYLFTYLGHEPAKSYMDPYFSWLYDKRLPKSEPVKEIDFIVDNNSILIDTEKL